MAVILQFRPFIVLDEGGQCELFSSELSDLEQLLKTMQVVDGVLASIRRILIEEETRTSALASLNSSSAEI